jgi:hypothetical protein
VITAEIKVIIGNSTRNFSWIKNYADKKNAASALTEHNKSKTAHAPLFENLKFAPFFAQKELQAYMTELHIYEAMAGVPLTTVPGAAAPSSVVVGAATAPSAAAEIKVAAAPTSADIDTPSEVTVAAHTKHPLVFNPNVSGKSCDVCRGKVALKGYGVSNFSSSPS